MKSFLGVLLVVFFLPGCNKSPINSDTVSFANDIEPLLNNKCAFAGCHGGINPNPTNGPMVLIAGASYGNLLRDGTGQPSTQMPRLKRVNPGKPDSSYIMCKLNGICSDGTPVVGTIMPPFGSSVTPDDKAKIRTWIAQGAQQN